MSEYYITKTKFNMLELRQVRFAEALKNGNEHPHDVCAIARDEKEMRSMVEKYLSGSVDWSGAK